MASLVIEGVPDALYERLRRAAGEGDCAVGDFVLGVVRRELEWLEWKERWVRLPVSQRTVSAAALLEEARGEHEGFIDAS